MTLYVKTGCPYCVMVLAKIEDLNIDVELKNVADEGVIDELIERGGRRMVPYFIDSENNVEMYESADIVDYLNEHYAKKEEEVA